MPRPASRRTAYYARVLRADVPLALDVLSDILADPTFDPDELAREKNVIVQEIGATEDTPDDLIFEYLQATAFPDQPVGRSILGTPRDGALVRSRAAARPISRATTARPTWWSRPRARSITQDRRRGGAPLRELRGPGGARAGAGAVSAAASRIEARDLEQVHVAFALEGVPQRDPSIYSLQVFTNVLGGGMSSRLFQEVREIRGLCYTVYAFHAAYADTGMLGVYAGTDAGRLCPS